MHRTPAEQRCNYPFVMDKDEELRVQQVRANSGTRSRYKLPALQILMLQEYPATALRPERPESHIQSLMYSTA